MRNINRIKKAKKVLKFELLTRSLFFGGLGKSVGLESSVVVLEVLFFGAQTRAIAIIQSGAVVCHRASEAED